MGVKYSQLPSASEVTTSDIVAILDASDNILKKATISQLPGGGGGGSDTPGLFIIRNQTLSFTNNVAIVSSAYVKESTCTLVYYTEATSAAAEAAGITVETNAGQVVFTAANTPSGTITCDIICIDVDAVPPTPSGYDNFVIRNQTLSFTNNVATVSNANITANTYATIYYTDSTIAAARAAGVSAQTTAGAVTFTATNTPGTITCDIVCTNM